MKKLTLLIAALVVSTCSFANEGLSKNSPQLNALGSAWKSHPAQVLNQHDLTMGYGGADISRRPTLAMHTTVV